MPDLLTPSPQRAGAGRRPRGQGLLARLAQARGGQVALTFALLAMPILFAAGAAVDYGRRNAAKAQLDAAIDAAVLGIIARKTNTITADMLDSARAQFMADAAKVPGVTVTSFVPVPIPGVSQVG